MKTSVMIGVFFLASLFNSWLFAATVKLNVLVTAEKYDRHNAVARATVVLPEPLAKNVKSVSFVDEAGVQLFGQVTLPRLLAKPRDAMAGSVVCELVFLVPAIKAGETKKFTALILDEGTGADKTFQWLDTPGQSTELKYFDRPVLRYMYAALDESSKERREETYKPYHHVFDPTGARLVTKGPGGLFPHHRGLFFGFNRISYDDGKKQADTWHCNKGEFESHESFVASAAGPVLGRHQLAIDWHGHDKQVFAKEQRELTVYNTPGGTLIEFASRLSSTVGKVKLDGDPQHAGFQFRASQELPDKTAKQTYYLRPDGQSEPGKFRNWDAKTRDPLTVNLPWNSLSFVLGEQRYTCCYLDRPENPKEARFSERDYGRFGSYFEYELDDGKPLELNYRIWLHTGEMTVSAVQSLANDFVAPVTVTVKQQ